MTVTIHEVQFHRNRRSGNSRAVCTCGWFYIGDTLEACQSRAATHDMEWEAVEVGPPPAPAPVQP